MLVLWACILADDNDEEDERQEVVDVDEGKEMVEGDEGKENC